jgi:hypothetical protein
MKKLPKHVHGYADRLGKARYYYKRTGNKPVALHGLPWSPGFMAEYDVAHAAYEQPLAVPLGASRTIRGTLDAGLVLYYESATFLQGLAKSTKARSAACWSAGARITVSCRCGRCSKSTYRVSSRNWARRPFSATCCARFATSPNSRSALA